MRRLLHLECTFLCVLAVAPVSWAATEERPPLLGITRATGSITLDGDLADEGWSGAAKVETWYETNPGDNTPPPVRNLGYLVYDDRYLYVGLDFEDKDPKAIRAPLGDRDNLSSTTDYGGVIIDPRNSGRSAILFLANARGLQYDAVTDDGGSGEDSSPDYYWDAAGRVTATGWSLEIRIPFSSLRYPRADVQRWGIMLYRNHPRAFRTQYFSTRLPRGTSCFICHSNPLDGLEHLPNGGHLVAAPYLSAQQTAAPLGDLGTPLDYGSVHGDAGLDVKWTPSASTALDATVNPDFSQVESDVAQIAANERFALFYSEKRPFFLEGIELLSTPIQAVYTRSITNPRFGARGTGKWGPLAFTGLVADDQGGGQVILPGPNGSDFADQDFKSFAAVGRARRDFGASFVSLLASDREMSDGYNRVFGPDFQWRPNKKDTVTGQFLYSYTRTPERTALAEEWNGQSMEGHAADLWWAHSTATFDSYGEYKDVGDGFRTQNGFVPQVGYREGYFETGYTWRPSSGVLRRFRTFATADYSADRTGDLLNWQLSGGFGLDGRWNSFVRLRYAWERVRAGNDKATLPRGRLFFTANASPSRVVSYVGVDGYAGGDIDFDGARKGSGARVATSVTLRPTNHIELRFDDSRRWVDVDRPGGGRARLFTASVDRVRATYVFTSRVFLRLIGQYVVTTRDPALYSDEVDRREATFSGSALLAYKVNWQTVVYGGYGDNRELSEMEELKPRERRVFLKISYAIQH